MTKALIEKILLFLAGGGAGGFAAWMILKKKYDKKLDEEIAEMRKVIEKGYNEGRKDLPPFEPDVDESDIEIAKKVSEKILQNANEAKNKENVREILERKGYVNYNHPGNEEPTRNEVPEEYDHIPEPDEIEVIAPEEYGELRDYDQETLYYLRDKILVDSKGNVIENVGDYVSFDALEQFGLYGEPDSVYVRNHHNQMDVAIYLRENETLATFSG